MGRPKLKVKIIAIKTQGRRKKRRVIHLDNSNVFGISEDVLLSSGFGVGDSLTLEEVADLQTEEEVYQVRESALHLLSYRHRSRGELRRRLMQKKYRDTIVERVLNELEEKKYINDQEFAHLLAREKVKNKYLGPFALRAELQSFALPADLVETTVTSVYQEFPLDQLVDRLLAKRRIDEKVSLSDKEKQRLRDFLYRKGYPWEVIESAFQRHHLW